MESYELQRLRELQSKYRMDGLQIERHGDRARSVQQSVQQAIDANEVAITKATKRHLAVGSTVWQGSKLNLFFDFYPDR